MPRRTAAETVTFIEKDDNDDVDDSKEFMTQTQFTFSQQPADRSQAVDTAKQSEFKKLDDLASTTRNRIITDLSRILLFKALGMKDPIDRTKAVSYTHLTLPTTPYV